MSSSNCCFLTCIQISQEAGQVIWYSHLFQKIHTVKGFGIVNKAEIDVFLGLSCFFDDPAAVGAAKSLQSCRTLCNPIDSSPPGSPVPEILQARTVEWVAISFSNAWKWSRSVMSDSSQPHGLQPTRLLRPWDFQARVLEWVAIAFSAMIQQMLAIWSLVPLPLLKPAWTSGSSRFTGLFQWVCSLHQSFQWIFRVDFL